MIQRIIFSLVLSFLMPCLCAAELPGLPQFIDEMVNKHQFKREELDLAFRHAVRRQSVIDAISTPATLKRWPEYRASFVNKKRLAGGLQFWQLHANALQRAESQFGIPQEIIVALIGVETIYGRNSGKFNSLDALTTLAFDYPRRADFFRGELEQYLLLARDQDFNLVDVTGSYAGALGIPQFMPSSYRKYALDYSGDGKINLLSDPVDAIGSVANYLNQYGWQKGDLVTVRVIKNQGNNSASLTGSHSVLEWMVAGAHAEKELAPEKMARLMEFTLDEGKEYWLAFANFDVITRYNNSDYYAMTVFQLAEALRNAHH
jgi:membrane-bound lytic murein transglycosylase B